MWKWIDNGYGKFSWKNVKIIIEITVIKQSNKLVLISKFVDENTHGIIINIINGFVIPPVKKNKKLNWKISTFKKKKLVYYLNVFLCENISNNN